MWFSTISARVSSVNYMHKISVKMKVAKLYEASLTRFTNLSKQKKILRLKQIILINTNWDNSHNRNKYLNILKQNFKNENFGEDSCTDIFMTQFKVWPFKLSYRFVHVRKTAIIYMYRMYCIYCTNVVSTSLLSLINI